VIVDVQESSSGSWIYMGIPLICVVAIAVLAVLFAFVWDIRRRSKLLRKFFRADHSFQVP
jgi:hypothetical protein